MTNMGVSSLEGADITTCLAPAAMWPAAFSLVRNRPVDSMKMCIRDRLNRYPALTGRDVFDAADDGDAAAKAVLDRYYDYVAAGITNLVNILSPEMVLIGGGISRQGERLLVPIRRYVAANCFGGTERPQPVIQAAQLGNEAGIIGAAAL